MFNDSIINQIREMLVSRQETLAVAESVTGGFLQAAMASAIEASGFFQGGITVYNLGQKTRHLAVDPVRAQPCNCVSPAIAERMALQVATMFISDWSIAITGYASPVPESGNKLFAHFAVCYRGTIAYSGRIECRDIPAQEAQLFYVSALLEKTAELILHQNSGG